MRAVLPILGLCLISLAAGGAHADVQPEAKPKTYALLAAVGGQFSFVHGQQQIGSHLSRFRHSSIAVPDNVLNRLVLGSLDVAVRDLDPDSKRIYLSLPAPQVDGVAAGLREETAIGLVAVELRKMPQRLEWDRIFVVTPAYSALERNGLAAKLQGLGVYMQPLQSNYGEFTGDASRDMGGDGVVTPDGKDARSSVYLAPYSYIELWVLDPKTLNVLEKHEVFDNQKIYDKMAGTLDMSENLDKKVLAQRIVDLIERSVHKAVTGTEQRGSVEVPDGKIVNPRDAKAK